MSTDRFANTQHITNDNSLFDQLTTMTKAHAYESVYEKFTAMKAENEALKKDVEVWKNIALKYRELVKQYEKDIQELLKK